MGGSNGKFTLVRFQPAAFALGVAARQVSKGGVASRLRVTELEAVPLAPVTLQEKSHGRNVRCDIADAAAGAAEDVPQ